MPECGPYTTRSRVRSGNDVPAGGIPPRPSAVPPILDAVDEDAVDEPRTGAGAPPPQVRLAGVSVGVEGLAGVVFAAVLAVRSLPEAAGEAGFFALLGAALVAVGIGLLTGRRWARTPAIVTQLLLLPGVYSLLGPSRQLVLGIVSGVFVIATFLLLIGERSREWSMGLDLTDPPGRS